MELGSLAGAPKWMKVRSHGWLKRKEDATGSLNPIRASTVAEGKVGAP